MKVVTLKDIPNVPVEGAEPIEGWTGPVSRSRQTIIEPGNSANYNCSVVNFSQGCTTGWHTHTCDQILVVTSGSGMVATEHEKHEINVGDVVHIKAGERHWHGAKANTTMGHITITAVGGQAKWGEGRSSFRPSFRGVAKAVNPEPMTTDRADSATAGVHGFPLSRE